MKRLTALLLLFTLLCASPTPATAAELQLNKGDHVCLVGNALGERLQHRNHWETSLHQSYPELQLVVRNLCFPGDEPFERIRSMDFGDPDSHLTHSKADVVVYFFGFNESFDGDQGLTEFAEQMFKLVQETQGKNFSGKGNARVVLVSPIAFEDIGDPNVTDGTEQNANLAKYTAALKKVAEESGAAFADIYTPTKALFESSDEQLTLNGAHLNDAGYKALSPLLMKALGLKAKAADAPAALKAEVDDKNFHWWQRYRAVNGFSIY
ncbi:MAG: SGNH/GDSL hydrolase family protein, partial [Fuerstiella sp.]|nr:SGNH/GDSL hydrolase family protein [Fuerstiella sp.]